jgi:uncharacterized lipoprotein YmbA
MRAGLSLLVVLVTMAACSSSPDIRYYTLSAEGTVPSGAHSPTTFPRRGPYAIARVIIPDLLDRPQIVLRTNTNAVEIREYDRWAAPLADQLERVLAADLAARLGPDAIIDPGLPTDSRAARVISVSILGFDPSLHGESSLEASWVISDAKSELKAAEVKNFRSSHLVPTKGADMQDVAQTMSDLVLAIADDIAASITESE